MVWLQYQPPACLQHVQGSARLSLLQQTKRVAKPVSSGAVLLRQLRQLEGVGYRGEPGMGCAPPSKNDRGLRLAYLFEKPRKLHCTDRICTLYNQDGTGIKAERIQLVGGPPEGCSPELRGVVRQHLPKGVWGQVLQELAEGARRHFGGALELGSSSSVGCDRNDMLAVGLPSFDGEAQDGALPSPGLPLHAAHQAASAQQGFERGALLGGEACRMGLVACSLHQAHR